MFWLELNISLLDGPNGNSLKCKPAASYLLAQVRPGLRNVYVCRAVADWCFRSSFRRPRGASLFVLTRWWFKLLPCCVWKMQKVKLSIKGWQDCKGFRAWFMCGSMKPIPFWFLFPFLKTIDSAVIWCVRVASQLGNCHHVMQTRLILKSKTLPRQKKKGPSVPKQEKQKRPWWKRLCVMGGNVDAWRGSLRLQKLLCLRDRVKDYL